MSINSLPANLDEANTSDLLIAAKSIIATPNTWCQGLNAVDEEGLLVTTGDSKACRWCSLGAILRIDPTIGYNAERMETALRAATHQMTYGRSSKYIKFNDNNSHEAVMQMWDTAIKLTQEQESVGN